MIRPPSAIVALGLRFSYGDTLVLDGVDLDVRGGHRLRAARPERRRQDDDRLDPLDAAARGRAARCAWPAATPAREPDAVRAAIGVTGQFAAVDNLLTGEENLILMADLHRLGRDEGRRRAAELLERFDLVDAAKRTGGHLLRRHEAPARPRDDARRRPADHLPRRADDGPGPAQPPHDVGDRARARRRRRDDLPDHAVPRGGRRARRSRRRARPRAADRRGHAGGAQAPHPGLAHPAAVRRPGAAGDGRRGGSTTPRATTPRSRCRSPATAASRSLRALLDRLDREAIEVEELSVHTPDLDDVFLTLHRDDDRLPTAALTHAAAQPAPRAALPVDDARDAGAAGDDAAAVQLRLRRRARGRHRRGRRAGTTSTTSRRDHPGGRDVGIGGDGGRRLRRT